VIDRKSERLLAAGAALEDLEPEEAVAWLTHRTGCNECRDLESDLTLVLEDLALIVPKRIPPPYLLETVRRSIGAAAVMTTLEDEGGATGEPGPPVVFGEI
jgi:hypothetical protein